MVSSFSTRSKRSCLTLCNLKRKLGTRRRKIKKTRESRKLRENGKRNALAQSISEKSNVTRVNKSNFKAFTFEKF